MYIDLSMDRIITKTLKTVALYIRVDPNEKRQIEQKAEARGLKLAQYVRKVLLAAK